MSPAYSKFIPWREGPMQPDRRDSERLAQNRRRWADLDDLYRLQNRQVEENVRMLAGQQWSVWHPVLNEWLDISHWMSTEERRWRQRPVFNLLLGWFILTHARATENPPIVTFVPGPDRIDAELAEVLDTAMKSLWWEAGMVDVHDRMMSWLIAAGRAHILSRIDRDGGELRPWVGADEVPVVDAYDQPILGPDGQPARQYLEGVPFDKAGRPLAQVRALGGGAFEPVILGEPHAEREGTIRADVLSPLQVRGSWGPTPWHLKRHHYVRAYLTPEEVYEHFGVEVAPDIQGGTADAEELERVLFGTGFYGAADQRPESQATGLSADGYCEVTMCWEKPGRDTQPEPGTHGGGRWLVTTRKQVVRDGPRPVEYPYTSPLASFEFVRLPGRGNGTTPQEMMNPVQRATNDLIARIKEHVNLSTNPKGVIDSASGLKPGQVTNAPGENYVVARRPGVPAFEFVAPPALGGDVYQLLDILKGFFGEMGQLEGTQGELPHPSASGELVKELRFNSDRFLGPTLRRSVEEYGRMYETWRAMLPIVWDQAKVLSYAGDDNIARTVTVYPQLFEHGKVNVRPDVESMLPEGRGEREARVWTMYREGLLGIPGSPEAVARFYELAHMPHLSRAAKPGGMDRTTAEQENGKLALGGDPAAIPVFEWYDDAVHLMVHESFMKSPEFLKLAPEVQAAFVFHRQAHMLNMQRKLMQQAVQQAGLNMIANPQPPGGPGGPGGEGGMSGPPPNEGPANEPADAPDSSMQPPLPAAPRGDLPGGGMPTVANLQ